MKIIPLKSILLGAVALFMMFALVRPSPVLADAEVPDGGSPAGEQVNLEETVPHDQEPPDAPQEQAGPAEGDLAEESGPAEQGENLQDVVNVLAENETVLVDGEGEALPLASQEAASFLSKSGDPSGTLGVARNGASVGDNFEYYRATGASGQNDGDCTYDGATLTCYFNAVLSQAVMDAASGSEILIAPEVFHETVSINKALKLTGVSGDATVDKFILLSGADLTGSSHIFANQVEVHPGAFIQDALNVAADGGVVDVKAGPYAEQLDITRSVTLQGAGRDSTFIVQDPTHTHCWGPSCGPGDRTLVEINGGDENASAPTINVKLDGFTLDGQYAYGMKFGILVHGSAYAEISNNLIKNFYDHAYPGGNQVNVLVGYWGQDWPWSGSAGVWNYTGHAYIHDNEVTGFNTVGMMVWGPNSTGILDHNIIAADPTDPHLSAGAMGIVLQRTGAVSVLNNVIQNLVTQGPGIPGWYRSGMEAYWPGNTIVSGNTFTNNDYGFAMYNPYAQPPGTTLSITGNTFSDNRVGLQLGGANIVSVTNNRFLNNSEIGVTNTMNTLVDVTNNWWGSADGPSAYPQMSYDNNGGLGTPAGSGDALSDFLLYSPSLTQDPFVSAPGAGAGTDNPPSGDTGAGSNRLLGFIPVTGGNSQRLVCPLGTNEVVLRLADGDQVRFIGLCDLDVVLKRSGVEDLPASLPEGTRLVSGMFVQVLQNGQLLKLLDPGSIEITFLVPSELQNKTLGLFLWDAATSTWMEIPLEAPESGFPARLNADDSTDQRVVLNGVSGDVLRAITQGNFSGLFVLVEK
ncbi:MAG: right-handed parallel beta-helix repeat-containing protein [Anaerolineaceae bacterium]|nr:right-handed parallel beta-helix repeat-containing protein [Anaerolineaceae bacterium]